MIADRWIPRLGLLGFLGMLAALGGFTLIAFRTETGFAPETSVFAPPTFQASARLEAGQIIVTARDAAGRPVSALSVRGVAIPTAGGPPRPLRFARDAAGRQLADWEGIGGGTWNAELTLRQGAAGTTLHLALPSP